MVLLYGSYASFLLAPQFPDQNAEMPARGNSRHHIGHVLSAASLSTKPGTPGALCESSSLGNQGRFQPMFCAGDVLEHTLEKADPPGAACRFSCREKRICFATSILGQQGGVVRSSGHASQKNSLVHSMAFCLDGSASGRTLLYKASCASFRVAGVGVPAIRKNAPGCVFLCSGGAFQKNVALRNRMHGRETGGTRRTGPGRRTASILSCIYDAYMARQEHFLLSGGNLGTNPFSASRRSISGLYGPVPMPLPSKCLFMPPEGHFAPCGRQSRHPSMKV